MTDVEVADLVAAARAGDQAAWDALVSRFVGLVWTVARSFGLGSADAADVSQATWLRLVERFASIREPDRIGAWLATTARREALAVLRRAGRYAVPREPEVLDRLAGAAPDAAEPVLRAEINAEVWRAFARIPGRCQRLLKLLVVEPIPSYQEIGASMDMPVGSIGATRARCLERLRRAMASDAEPHPRRTQ